MVSCARLEGEAPHIIPVSIRKTIHSIREIVGNHSDADIYAALKECNMDPNETVQKLLNQDPFHEVRRKRDKRKEFTGYELAVDPRKHTESNHREKSNNSMHLNAHRGGFTRSYVPDARVNKEFRVVRDNRVNQTLKKDAKLDSVQRSLGKEHVKANIFEKSILDDLGLSQDMKTARSQGLDHEKNFSRSSRSVSSPPEKIAATPQSSKSEPERAVLISSAINSSSASTSSVIGVYSTLDPVHVPSPASRSAITVGAIRREIGAVGIRKQSSDGLSTNSAVSNNSLPVSLGGEIILASADSPRYPATNIKSSQVNQVPIPDTVMPTTTNRRIASVQSNSKHLQSFNHQRAMPPNMEWKPKIQKLKTESSCAIEVSSALPSSNENELSSNLVDATDLTNKLSHVNVHGEQHVIIPQHLRVPEAEFIKLTFGSFGDGSESSKEFLSTQQSIDSAEQSEVTPSVSNSASVPVGPNEETSSEIVYADYQAGTSRSVSPASAEDLERPSSQNNESLNPQNIESYADIGLVRSHSPPYSSQQPQRLHEIPSIPNFSPYGTEASYVTPFFQTTLEDNARGHCLASPAEILNLHAPNMNSLTTATITQQQQQAPQQQQQALTQIYPQIHISHYPNFMPYRHILSPLYGPPMAMPNYSSNPAYAHPSAGSSYVLMPGGTSHLPTGGIKYPPSQYKPLPTGSPTAYGNYSSPAAFAIGTPSPIGGPTGLEDVTRIKFKDNNIYVPNQQADASDMWMQNARELAGLQTPYYNLSGHGAHPTAFVSAQAATAGSGHTSFNAVAAAAQPPPMQYPGMYHTPQPASIPGPHHLVHQQVPAPVGMAAGGQVGAFQQTQLGRLNWTANF
ncbi:hypothetical protein KSP40_PGU018764 [Platanthera guangdongensis]|uniref:GBF-interacting protein 1 N-terminal domain-containing protein n=1 Tax=Platanthera guangdongensis TaxID=2320717 RepID=A0ABR2MVK1_9ASPA